MKKILLVVTISCFAVLAGCKEEAKTTKWYRDHPDELKVVYDKCKKSGDASENCKNANEAHYQIEQLNAPEVNFN
ncbi:EexN family lipoprotein [Salmonella enterica]|nr:EexN family lipoprotein [Salmonella enterica]EHV2061163.1 EexN family lipoprotein [Salmonella enterica]